MHKIQKKLSKLKEANTAQEGETSSSPKTKD